ncbi:MAG TPA: PA domain-containing protein, partial [Pilimelia sp.]|nr:PA domain-containing protein [Pilimelia sp.]
MRKLAIPVAALLVVALAPTPALAVDKVNTKRLRDAVTVNSIMGHERVLQRIANQNGGTRASGTPGYAASVAYVTQVLAQAGYRVTEQEFTFPFYRELAPAELAQVSPTATTYQTVTFDFSGSGEVTGQVVPVKDNLIPPPATPGSTAGCQASDFTPAGPDPQIALIQRGTCEFGLKARNAQAAGYDAVIIFNEGQPGRQDPFEGTLGGPVGIPVVGMSYADGAALNAAALAGEVTVRVKTTTEVDAAAKTSNVIADSPGGDANKVLVVGAHL